MFRVQLANESSPGAPRQARKERASSSEDPYQAPRKTPHHPATGRDCTRSQLNQYGLQLRCTPAPCGPNLPNLFNIN